MRRTRQQQLLPDPAIAGRIATAHTHLVALLRGRRWVRARELARHGFPDRMLRLIVEHDTRAEILSYPGSPGYCLYEEATLQEIQAAEAMRRQIRKMTARYTRLVRRRHGRLPRR